MKRAMLSQPMAGKTDEEIVATREKAIEVLKEKGYEIVNTLFTDEWYSNESMKERGVVQIPLCFLAKSLENMSLCHAAYFCKGWENSRGCRIEHDAAVEAFSRMYKTAVQAAVKDALKGNPPKGGTGGKTMTKEQIMAISNPVERQRLIAENIALFQ